MMARVLLAVALLGADVGPDEPSSSFASTAEPEPLPPELPQDPNAQAETAEKLPEFNPLEHQDAPPVRDERALDQTEPSTDTGPVEPPWLSSAKRKAALPLLAVQLAAPVPAWLLLVGGAAAIAGGVGYFVFGFWAQTSWVYGPMVLVGTALALAGIAITGVVTLVVARAALAWFAWLPGVGRGWRRAALVAGVVAVDPVPPVVVALLVGASAAAAPFLGGALLSFLSIPWSGAYHRDTFPATGFNAPVVVALLAAWNGMWLIPVLGPPAAAFMLAFVGIPALFISPAAGLAAADLHGWVSRVTGWEGTSRNE